jgi:hypothetical protein
MSSEKLPSIEQCLWRPETSTILALQASSLTEVMRPWRPVQVDTLARIAGHPVQKLDKLMP